MVGVVVVGDILAEGFRLVAGEGAIGFRLVDSLEKVGLESGGVTVDAEFKGSGTGIILKGSGDSVVSIVIKVAYNLTELGIGDGFSGNGMVERGEEAGRDAIHFDVTFAQDDIMVNDNAIEFWGGGGDVSVDFLGLGGGEDAVGDGGIEGGVNGRLRHQRNDLTITSEEGGVIEGHGG